MNNIVLGGGCFWCLEAFYQNLDGVEKVQSGYAGGDPARANYEDVCSGTTGHAEVIEIEYDETKLDLKEILNFFWRCHDPTTLNRQGNDVGTQYRSTIMVKDEEELKVAEESRAHAQRNFSAPIVTEVVLLERFFVAEDYHLNYYRRNPGASYCQYVIRPKLEKLGIES